MAKRTWRAGPDAVYDNGFEEIPFVTVERLTETVLHGVSMLHVSGGSLIVTVGRQPTDVEGEALTTGVVCRWQDGPRAKLQPEAAVDVPLPQLVEPGEIEQITALQDEQNAEDAALLDEDNPDGLDPATLDEEDESAIPEALR